MKIAILALVSLTLAACAASAQKDALVKETIAGTKWAVAHEGAAGEAPRLEFGADGKVSGYTGCNMLGGSWRIEGDAVRLGPLITTKRACPGAGDAMERRFLQAVSGNARLVIEGGRLVGQGEGGARIELVRG